MQGTIVARMPVARIALAVVALVGLAGMGGGPEQPLPFPTTDTARPQPRPVKPATAEPRKVCVTDANGLRRCRDVQR